MPPSNLNRDDTGSPKTARYGGVVRARVSSQAWKRAIRAAFEELFDRSELGVRTKRLIELIGDEIVTLEPALAQQAPRLAKDMLAAAGIKTALPKGKKDVPEESGYLVFLSHRQVIGLAELAVHATTEAAGAAVAIPKTVAKARADARHSVDVALFGRMVAEAIDLNVDAAAQVAHALSVHAVENEYDYFTAVDDHKKASEEEDAGAGMIGTVEFNSATLYRYATIDVDRLRDNLGDAEATRRAVEAFARAFVRSMPTGKQNTFANRTLPDAVLVVLRDTQSINLVGAFEDAISGRDHGRVPDAIARLATHAVEVHEAYAETPVAAWTFGPGERLAPLAAIAERGDAGTTVAALGAAVRSRLR
ncbi:type I-E CRISPR-associated protein Cas7/Cse4/CasC [Pseudonocardia yunnanensis]